MACAVEMIGLLANGSGQILSNWSHQLQLYNVRFLLQSRAQVHRCPTTNGSHVAYHPELFAETIQGGGVPIRSPEKGMGDNGGS